MPRWPIRRRARRGGRQRQSARAARPARAARGRGAAARVIEGQGNIGFAGGCNLAARHIESDFLLLLNPDCLLPPGGAGLLRAELRRRPGPALLGAVMVDSAGEVQRATRRNLPSLAGLLGEALSLYRLMPGWPRIEIEGPLPTETTAVPAISGAAMFLTRENYWALGGLDSGYFLHVEDLDLCARFRKAGGEVWLVPALRLQHGRSSSEATHLFIEAHKTRGFRRYFRKQGLGLAGACCWRQLCSPASPCSLYRLGFRLALEGGGTDLAEGLADRQHLGIDPDLDQGRLARGHGPLEDGRIPRSSPPARHGRHRPGRGRRNPD
jgi:Predicted glycosyltransferases